MFRHRDERSATRITMNWTLPVQMSLARARGSSLRRPLTMPRELPTCYIPTHLFIPLCSFLLIPSPFYSSPPLSSVRAMAFVPPDNLRRLIMQYYRQHGKHVPKNATFSLKSFLFVKYHCDFGYEMVDEVDTLFCQNKEWVNTMPRCVGKGIPHPDCFTSPLSSRSLFQQQRRMLAFLSLSGRGTSRVQVSPWNDPRRRHEDLSKWVSSPSPSNGLLEPIPKTLCRSLAGCSCSSIDDNQYTCTCPKGTKCLLLKGPPKIYVEPAGPYEVAPGGNINISCAAVAYPFPEIYWQR